MQSRFKDRDSRGIKGQMQTGQRSVAREINRSRAQRDIFGDVIRMKLELSIQGESQVKATGTKASGSVVKTEL